MKKLYNLLIISLLLISILHTINQSYAYKISSDIIYVNFENINGPWDGTINHPYKQINDAINNVTSENTIFVFNGIYNETISIDKRLTLIGENKTNTIIDGEYKNNIIELKKSNITISNFTIRNSAGLKNSSGIKTYFDKTIIKNCIIYKTKTAISLVGSNNSIIDNCTLSTNGEAILLKNLCSTDVTGCRITHSSIGINIDESNNIKIEFSCFDNNGISCLFNNSRNIQIIHSNISDNSVNIGGIFLVNCSEIAIKNNNINHNGAGICLFSCNEIQINNSNFKSNTHFALSFRTASDNVIVNNCNIFNNYRFGFYIEEDNNCIIKENNIFNNRLYGINAKKALINARNNWWGSKYGPSFSEFRKADRIKWVPFKTKYYPWEKNRFESIGSNWQENKGFMNKKDVYITKNNIKLIGNDSDNDLIPDWWEVKWGYNKSSWDDHANLDPDDDALNNIEECYTDKWDSNPYKKDIFLELDYMQCPNPEDTNKPTKKYIDKVVKIFFDHDINLHIDLGELGGGEEIPFCKNHFTFSKLRDLYWDYFLHNNLTNPRKGIFHYGMICNYCPDLNFPFFGWSDFDSFAISAEWLKELNPLYSRDRLIVGGVVHHLGHTLGLLADSYEGIDNLGAINPLSIQFWKYLNYKSCMHYLYKYDIFTYSDGDNGRGDFNDWENIDYGFFKETNFKENYEFN